MIQTEVAVVCTAFEGLQRAQAGRDCRWILPEAENMHAHRRATLAGHAGPEGDILHKIEGICDDRDNSYSSYMVVPQKELSPP